MGLFDKLLGRRPPAVEPEPEPDPDPDAVLVLRHGMNVPDDAYVAQVLASAFPSGLSEACCRQGLAQPSWFKNAETAESCAADVALAFGRKLDLGEPAHVHRILQGPDGAKVLVVELRRS